MAVRSTFDELIDKVVLKGIETKADIETEIKAWLNEAYDKIKARNLDCLKTETTFNTVIGIPFYALSTVAPHFRDPIAVFSNLGKVEIQPLQKVRALIYGLATADRTPGQPIVCWFKLERIYLEAVPDAIYPITIEYYQEPDALTLPGEFFLVPQRKEFLLINYALAIYDFKAKDWDAVNAAKAEFYAELAQWENEDSPANKDMDYSNVVELQGQFNQEWRGDS